MQFTEFKTAVQRQFMLMSKHELFRTRTDKDELWETYLKSFPEGTNPLFRERTEHDCSSCRSFIRAVGNMTAIIDDKLVSIWDVNIGGYYQTVADALSAYVKSCSIENIFLHDEPTAGTDKNYENTDNGVLTWEHFYIQLPAKLISKEPGGKLSEARAMHDVFLRSLREIKPGCVETVQELIAQNSIYRGAEKKVMIDTFYTLQQTFNTLKTEEDRDLFAWACVKSSKDWVCKIRNDVIGTLLTDLSGYTNEEGRAFPPLDLEIAVKRFEDKVAGTNYKRPTALVTQAMKDSAKAKLEELGLTSALDRRYAVLEDISITNVLFADRSARKRMADVFDEIPVKAHQIQNFNNVEVVSIATFINELLPRAETIEVMFENSHINNLVSLIAPADLTAKSMFKWGNSFSWSYTGDVADSIKERVKAAGGNVTGDVCCRLAWYNPDDLDLHMVEADKHRIYYQNRRTKSRCGGTLDVDANGADGPCENPVENIYYGDMSKMLDGDYSLQVHQYHVRNTANFGFEAEIDIKGVLHNFVYPKAVKQGEYIDVAKIQVRDGVAKVVPILSMAQATKTVWNLPTLSFHKVNVVALSPNCWDGKEIGNKHYFFFLDGCKNDGSARGFYNEFLTSELETHRKVFEMVGSRMRTDASEHQLSGLGFSSTQRNQLLCRITGSFTRTIKIQF